MTHNYIVSEMNDYDFVLKQLAENEVRCGCETCVVDGIPVWDALRYKLRISYLRKQGFDYLDPGFPVRIGGLLRSVIKSFFQICRVRGSYECIFRRRKAKSASIFASMTRSSRYTSLS